MGSKTTLVGSGVEVAVSVAVKIAIAVSRVASATEFWSGGVSVSEGAVGKGVIGTVTVDRGVCVIVAVAGISDEVSAHEVIKITNKIKMTILDKQKKQLTACALS